jgi:hypothetical protein
MSVHVQVGFGSTGTRREEAVMGVTVPATGQ